MKEDLSLQVLPLSYSISLLPLTVLSVGEGLKTLCEGKAVKVVDQKSVYIAPFEGGASRGSYVSQGVRPERVPAGAGESLSFCSFCPSSVPLPGYSTPSRNGCHKHSLYWLNISYLSIWKSLSHCLSLTNVWHYYIGRKVLPGLTEWIWCPHRS